mmetsp:Transcript_51913/g.120651  ORF Transcript_51913/g.120651 Transcript_51913/m.120651 type:complete len:265 (-) Transcript_51913:15-809(-)
MHFLAWAAWILAPATAAALALGIPALHEATEPSASPSAECSCQGCTSRFHTCVARKRLAAQGNCGRERCDVVFVGDSIVERLGGSTCFSRLNVSDSGEAYRAAFGIAHPGTLLLGGACDQTQQTLYLLEHALPVLRAPRVYFVLVGTNNIPRGGTEHARSGVRAVVERLRRVHPQSQVLLHAVLPRLDDGGKAHFQEKITALNRDLASLAGDKVRFVDCTRALGTPAEEPQHFDNIMLHPSPAGYATWLRCVSLVVDSALDSTA